MLHFLKTMKFINYAQSMVPKFDRGRSVNWVNDMHCILPNHCFPLSHIDSRKYDDHILDDLHHYHKLHPKSFNEQYLYLCLE